MHSCGKWRYLAERCRKPPYSQQAAATGFTSSVCYIKNVYFSLSSSSGNFLHLFPLWKWRARTGIHKSSVSKTPSEGRISRIPRIPQATPWTSSKCLQRYVLRGATLSHPWHVEPAGSTPRYENHSCYWLFTCFPQEHRSRINDSKVFIYFGRKR